jgi:hypothetical protein
MKKIKLTQGQYALVDDDDFERLNQFKWYVYKTNSVYRPARKIRVSGKQKNIHMHQEIMGTFGKGHNFSVDHIDHNPLNNQKENLRVCNNSENIRNQKVRVNKTKTSIYKGVCLYMRYNKFISQIRFENKQIHLGYFINEKDAACAYNKKALELFGEFACLNKID